MSLSAESKLILEPLNQNHLPEFSQMVVESRAHVTPWLSEAIIPANDSTIPGFMDDWICGAQEKEKFGFLLRDEISKKAVGFGLINQINPNHHFANLGYWITASARGNGYAVLAISLLADFALQQLQLARVELLIDSRNDASKKVAQRAGALYEGCLQKRLFIHGQHHEAELYSITNDKLD